MKDEKEFFDKARKVAKELDAGEYKGDKLVEEAPYHPGYEDAVIPPTPKYTGMNPAKMIWKPKPLTDDEIGDLYVQSYIFGEFDEKYFARSIEEKHGIK